MLQLLDVPVQSGGAAVLCQGRQAILQEARCIPQVLNRDDTETTLIMMKKTSEYSSRILLCWWTTSVHTLVTRRRLNFALQNVS